MEENKNFEINFPDKQSITIEKIGRKLKNNSNLTLEDLSLSTNEKKYISNVSLIVSNYINYLVDNNLSM